MRTRSVGAARRVALLVVGAIGCATSQSDSSPKAGDRGGAVQAKLDQARTLRTSGHGEAALSALSEALRLEARGPLELPDNVKAEREAEIAAAGETVEAAIRADLAAKAPLCARRRADKLAPLLESPPLQAINQKATAEIATGGRARCAELVAQQDGRTPYLARMLADYCAKIGGAPGGAPGGPSGGDFSAPAAPEQAGGLRVSGRLEHCTDAQQKIVEGWMADVFRDSPWFAAGATNMLPLALSGGYKARLERQRVVLNAPYRDVTHSVITRGLLGPTATVETESERIFQYEAEQYDARYDLAMTVSLDFGGGPPLAVSVKRLDNKRAFQHEVSFPKANVYPQRASLPDINTWLTTSLGGKKAPMVRKLRARWVKSYCVRSTFSPEEAARCLQAGERRPAAELSLVELFGKDTPLVVEDLMRARAEGDRTDGPKEATAAKKTPDVQEVPQAGGGETI